LREYFYITIITVFLESEMQLKRHFTGAVAETIPSGFSPSHPIASQKDIFMSFKRMSL